MRKKTTALLLTVLLICSLVACNGGEAKHPTPEESAEIFYDALYNNIVTEEDIIVATAADPAVRTFRADGSGEATVYGNYKCADEMSSAFTIRLFQNGREIHTGTVQAGDVVGKYFEVAAVVASGDTFSLEVTGDCAKVLCDPVVTFDNSQNENLHRKTDYDKYYGDLYPWYNEETGELYMGYMWSDNVISGNDGLYLRWGLDVADNLLKFENKIDEKYLLNYNINMHLTDLGNEYQNLWRQEYYLNYLQDLNRYIEVDKYKGVSDGLIMKDEENSRYVFVTEALYKHPMFGDTGVVADMICYVSEKADLSLAPQYAEWTGNGNFIARVGYEERQDPMDATGSALLWECTNSKKIGDRWYIFTSIAFQSVHQVGQLKYLVGDPGVDLMEMDWTKAKTGYFDGEDLCVAKVASIGNTAYVYGWIPYLYNTMPNVPWGGFINLPREVVQQADGTLGGRLDPGLQKVLNYGNMYFAAAETVTNGKTALDGGTEYNRNYITFHVSMGDSNKVAYILEQEGKTYEVAIVKENGATYMKVLSPEDSLGHTENSFIKIADDVVQNEFDIQIVVDGQVIEFFANGLYGLTAITAMGVDTSKPIYNNGESGVLSYASDGYTSAQGYTMFLYADGTATFTDISVNKLIPYGALR